VINRYGFNNDGMKAAMKRLAAYPSPASRGMIIGVNIGANKDSADRVQDYLLAAEELSPYADYITVNVSSPNTPGLRGLQEPKFLKDVLKAAKAGMKSAGAIRPLMLKIAPDLDHEGLLAAIDVALKEECQGLIIANTTVSRPDHLQGSNKNQAGGLSGRPLFTPSSQMLMEAYAHLKSIEAEDKLPLIAAGGVDSAEAAYVKLLLGASLVQLYTGLALKGPQLPSEIVTGLGKLLERDGAESLNQIRGASLNFEEAVQRAGLSLGK
jgi:dihydroorotate dehydrogenase